MPSFAIEAAGEANPLTESTIHHALEDASSSDPIRIQTGTKQLQQWEKSRGYYVHLQSVFTNHERRTEVRYLAVIQLKNGIDKYWRKTAQNAVGKEDKSIIRSRIIESGAQEADHRLALQNALVIAKIVRYDYPHDWPDAIVTVLHAIRAIRNTPQETTSPVLERCLLVLLHIIKELSTARLQRSRTALQQTAPEILKVIGDLYLDRVNAQWQGALSNEADSTESQRLMSQSLLAIRTARRLIIAGYDFPNRHEDVQHFWSATIAHIDPFINGSFEGARLKTTMVAHLLRKHLIQLSKFHLSMAETHPSAFVLLPSSLDLVHGYWNFAKLFSDHYGATSTAFGHSQAGLDDEEDDDARTPERLSLNALLLIRACVRMAYKPAQTFRYKHDQEKEERKQTESTVKQILLTPSFVGDVLNTVVPKFLRLRSSDLEAWQDEPEEWIFQNDQESENLHLSVRACSERIILELGTYFKDVLLKTLRELFQFVTSLKDEDVLLKDAIYNAIGITAPVLQEGWDFDAMMKSVLVTEVQKEGNPGYKVLRRRVAIVAAQWIVVNVQDETRLTIYMMFQHLLQEQGQPLHDKVVRITAGSQLKHVVDDFEFKSADFAPFADRIITDVMALVQEVEQTSTKLTLIETISVLIERFEHKIEPYADRIVAILPGLWDLSGVEHLMKQSIIALLARLVNALKHDSSRFHPAVIQIVQSTLEPESELRFVLIEETLDLWHAVIVQTISVHSDAPDAPKLLSLLHYLFPLLEQGSETLRESLQIIESYLLLAPSEMLSDEVRIPLLGAFAKLITSQSKPDVNGMACVALELSIRLVESLGGEAAIERLLRDLSGSQILTEILTGLHSAWSSRHTTGPNSKPSSIDSPLETDYLSLLSRLVIPSPELFMQAKISINAAQATQMRDNLEWLLDEWFAHLDNVSDPSRRKLSALALTRLLDISDPTPLLNNLQLYLTTWTSVVNELCERDPAGAAAAAASAPTGAMHLAAAVDIDTESDSLVYTDPNALRLVVEGAVEAPEDVRRRESSWFDIVHRLALPVYIREKLGAVVARCGGMAPFREQWVANVDRSVVEAFDALRIFEPIGSRAPAEGSMVLE